MLKTGGQLITSDLKNRLKPYKYLAGILSRRPLICGKIGSPAVYTVKMNVT